jgi:hypothetical protein
MLIGWGDPGLDQGEQSVRPPPGSAQKGRPAPGRNQRVAMQTRWIRPIRILGIVLLIDAPISGAFFWRDQRRLAGMLAVASHLLLGFLLHRLRPLLTSARCSPSARFDLIK